ncbi:hypothetical protein BGZ75_002332 [Mortierella antarctica]|nr:hypothetical protein BGZ75_002332 [Mortierella antarctica]
MARSTLFSLVVLVLIQVALAVPFGVGLIVNRATNGVLKGEPFRPLTVGPGDFYTKPWIIKPFEEGVLIEAVGTPRLFVNADYGRAVLTPEEQKWYFENAGENLYKIKLPNEDQVLGLAEGSNVVRLQGANGSDEQLWSIRGRDGYSRMYRQY